MSLRSRIDRLERCLQSHPAKAAESRDDTAAWLDLVALHIRDAPYAQAHLTPAEITSCQDELHTMAGEVRAGRGPMTVLHALEVMSVPVLYCLESLIELSQEISPTPAPASPPMAPIPENAILDADGVPYEDEGLKEAREAMARAWASVDAGSLQ